MCSILSTSELPNGTSALTHSTLRAPNRLLVGSSIQIAYETIAQQSRPRMGVANNRRRRRRPRLAAASLRRSRRAARPASESDPPPSPPHPANRARPASALTDTVRRVLQPTASVRVVLSPLHGPKPTPAAISGPIARGENMFMTSPASRRRSGSPGGSGTVTRDWHGEGGKVLEISVGLDPAAP